MEKPKYRRVLLKISGEALAGDKHFGLDFGVIGQVTDVIKECACRWASLSAAATSGAA